MIDLRQFSSPPAPGDAVVVICWYWPPDLMIRGAVPALCDWCGREVTKAPTTQEMIDSRNGAPVYFCCPDCFLMGKPETSVTWRTPAPSS